MCSVHFPPTINKCTGSLQTAMTCCIKMNWYCIKLNAGYHLTFANVLVSSVSPFRLSYANPQTKFLLPFWWRTNRTDKIMSLYRDVGWFCLCCLLFYVVCGWFCLMNKSTISTVASQSSNFRIWATYRHDRGFLL